MPWGIKPWNVFLSIFADGWNILPPQLLENQVLGDNTRILCPPLRQDDWASSWHSISTCSSKHGCHNRNPAPATVGASGAADGLGSVPAAALGAQHRTPKGKHSSYKSLTSLKIQTRLFVCLSGVLLPIESNFFTSSKYCKFLMTYIILSSLCSGLYCFLADIHENGLCVFFRMFQMVQEYLARRMCDTDIIRVRDFIIIKDSHTCCILHEQSHKSIHLNW